MHGIYSSDPPLVRMTSAYQWKDDSRCTSTGCAWTIRRRRRSTSTGSWRSTTGCRGGIPADQPLEGANAGLKLEFRRENTSIYQSFEDLSINGHTNGEWMEMTMVIECDDISPDFPPYPVAVNILPIRFGAEDSTGTIFWGDLSVVQDLDAGCDPGCYADFNDDGVLNILDFVSFQTAFVGQDPAADCNTEDIFNILDFVCFQGEFVKGCD